MIRQPRQLNKATDDSGSALIMVILLIVFLSLTLASLAVLTQSANSAISTNSKLSELRASRVSDAFSIYMSALTPNPNCQTNPDDTNVTPCRIGTNENPCEYLTNLSSSHTNLYNPTLVTQLNNFKIQIECKNKTDSGAVVPLATFVISGSGASGVIGTDYGLVLGTGGQASCGAADSKLALSGGGLLNSSGKWTSPGPSCKNIYLDVDLKAKVKTQNTGVPGCSGLTSASASPLSPILGEDYQLTTHCVNDPIPHNLEIDFSGSRLNNYAKSIYRQVPQVSSSSPFCGGTRADYCGLNIPAVSAMNNNTCRASTISTTWNGTKVYVVQPNGFSTLSGALTAESLALSALNEKKIALANTSDVNNLVELINKCSSQGTPIIIQPMNYRFFSTSAFNFSGNSGKTIPIIAGVPNLNTFSSSSSDYDTCDSSKKGVQFQFSGPSRLIQDLGGSGTRFIICGIGRAPAMVAPNALASPSEVDFSSSPSGAIIDVRSSSGVKLHFSNLVFVPGGYVSWQSNGSQTLNLTGGLVAKGWTSDITGSVSTTGNVAAEPLANGDRLIQLHFKDLAAPSYSSNLGVVQVKIQDDFGVHPGKGYKILLWRIRD